MNIYTKKTLLSILFIGLIITSCDKQTEWLDVKNNKTTVVPETLKDFQAMLDNSAVLNKAFAVSGSVGADNFQLTSTNFTASSENERNLFVWNTEGLKDFSNGWSNFFKMIEVSNIIIEGLEKIGPEGQNSNNVKGQALFFRAIAYYELSQLFCKAYTTAAENDLGLPLRLTSDVNVIEQRSSLSATYKQILSDAIEAGKLLNDSQPYLQRPVKAAAFALAAKTYLNMGDYKNALIYADMVLLARPQLLDYNDISIVNINTTYRFPVFAKNIPEILFYAQGSSTAIGASTSSRGTVVPELYQSYDANDLRKSLFFAITGVDAKYRGTYTGQAQNFCGITTSEIYLIRAECYARQDNVSAAMADLHTLLSKRYIKDKAPLLSPSDADEALQIILTERRKELGFIGNIRWGDLKRLNIETRFQKTLTRSLNGKAYSLLPNSPGYLFPIPNEEIQLSGIRQN